jgi:hypothetical protein
MRYWFERLLVWVIIAGAAAGFMGYVLSVQGAPINGVLSQARVIKLPEDGLRWHISVVGSDARYREVLAWFDAGKLKDLRSKCHFHSVLTTDPIYEANYKATIKALPTVRVQDAKGVVIYEESTRLPMSGDGLYAAIAAAANGSEELLPWRRNHATPAPNPDPAPLPDTDPEPPPLDEGNGPPVFEDQYDIEGIAIIVCMLLLVAGVAAGQVEAHKNYHKDSK